MSYVSDIMRDPLKECEIYKQESCSHVDGLLCNFPDCTSLKNMNMEKQIAYVIIEYFGQYEDSYQNIYGVTLSKVKAEILKAESIESHKKTPESELSMTWDKFNELQDIYEEKLEEFDWSDEKLISSGWKFDSYSLDDYYAMLELYNDYFNNDYACTSIIESNLY